MQPHHLFTRLRQDIRKMASAPDEGGYLRYKHYASNKLARARMMLKANELLAEHITALQLCIETFQEVIHEHDSVV